MGGVPSLGTGSDTVAGWLKVELSGKIRFTFKGSVDSRLKRPVMCEVTFEVRPRSRACMLDVSGVDG